MFHKKDKMETRNEAGKPAVAGLSAGAPVAGTYGTAAAPGTMGGASATTVFNTGTTTAAGAGKTGFAANELAAGGRAGLAAANLESAKVLPTIVHEKEIIKPVVHMEVVHEQPIHEKQIIREQRQVKDTVGVVGQSSFERIEQPAEVHRTDVVQPILHREIIREKPVLEREKVIEAAQTRATTEVTTTTTTATSTSATGLGTSAALSKDTHTTTWSKDANANKLSSIGGAANPAGVKYESTTTTSGAGLQHTHK